MPNRILKESICSSESIDQLSLFSEVVFYRLIVNCDDYGRFDGREKIIKSRLFPLKDVGDSDIAIALKDLEEADLIAFYYVNGKRYIQMKTWDKHQQVRAHKSKYPAPDDIGCKQMISDDYKCPRNPIQSESEYVSESVSESELPDETAHAIQMEQNKVLEAAHNASFNNSPTVNAMLVALYADYGLDRVLNALTECATHNAPTIAYLRAVLTGSGRKKEKPKSAAHNFEERDYSEVPGQIRQQMEDEMEAFMKRGDGSE